MSSLRSTFALVALPGALALLVALGAGCGDSASEPDANVADAKVADAGVDAPKPDAPRPDAPRPDAPKPDAPKPDAPKPDSKPPQQDTMPPDGTTNEAGPDAATDAAGDGPVGDGAVGDGPVPDGPVPDGPVPDATPALYTVSGTLSQFGGDTQGTEVYVRAYASNDPSKIFEHVTQTQINVISGQNVSNVAFTLSLPNGTYYLRAWRDNDGRGGAPDGQPTLTTDPQSRAKTVVVNNTNTTNVAINITARGNTVDSYDGFDVRTRNSSDVAPPIGDVNNVRVAGPGRCGGFYLSMQADRSGAGTTLTVPRVRLPSGTIVEMLDDGGCSDAVLDNRNKSYDTGANDNTFSYGIADPQASASGGYTFFYHQSVDDFIHIETDTLTSIVRLSRARQLTAPSGAARNTSLRPSLTWQAVPNAGYYAVDLTSLDGQYDNGADPNRVTTTATYTPPTNINDDACYQVLLTATDSDPTGDVDAESASVAGRFCTDVDGAQSITVSGTLNNNTSLSDAISVFVTTADGRASSVWLASSATSYTVSVLAGTDATEGSIVAFADGAGTANYGTPANRRLGVSIGTRDFRTSATVNLGLNPGPSLNMPAPWATASSIRPALSWMNYGTVTGRPTGAWSYLLRIGDANNPRLAAIVLPSNTTAIDLASLPQRTQWFDLNALRSCDNDGGTFSVNASGTPVCGGGGTITPSQTVLVAGTLYDWSLSIVECDFAQFAPPSLGNFATCLRGVISSDIVYATSELRGLQAP